MNGEHVCLNCGEVWESTYLDQEEELFYVEGRALLSCPRCPERSAYGATLRDQQHAAQVALEVLGDDDTLYSDELTELHELA